MSKEVKNNKPPSQGVDDNDDNMITIIHQNIQSIKSDNQIMRKESIINLIKKHLDNANPLDFIMLSETWVDKKIDIRNWIKYDESINHSYDIISDHVNDEYNMTGKGTAIIIRKEWIKYIQKVVKIPGRLIAIEIKRLDKTYMIITIYLPHNKNDEEHKKVRAKVFQILNEAKPTTKVIIGGDWNMVTDDNKDRKTTEYNNPNNEIRITETNNKNAKKSNFVNQLTKKNYTHPLVDIWRLRNKHINEYTHETINNKKEKSYSRIDYFLVSSHMIQEIIDAKILDQIIDRKLHHKPIKITVRNKLIREPKFQKNTDPKRLKLLPEISDEAINNFNIEIKKSIDIIKMKSKSINENQSNITRSIYEGIKKHIPTKKSNCNNMNFAKTRTHRRLVQDWRAIQMLQRELNNTIKIDSKTIQKILRIAKRYAPENTDIETIDLDQLTEQTLQWITRRRRKIKHKSIKDKIEQRDKRMIDDQKRHINNIFEHKIQWDGLRYLKDEETGTITIEPEKIKTKIKNYFESLFKQQEIEKDLDDNWINEYNPISDIQETWYNDTICPIKLEELSNCIKNLPNNKSPGPSGLSYDMLKIITDNEILEGILIILNQMLNQQKVPSNEELSKIILLPKSDNWQGEISKLRPITLLETLRKILSNILTKRLTKVIDEHHILKGNNLGFRTGCSTTNILAVLRACIDTANLKKHPLIIACLDIKKAYDTVPWRAVEYGLHRIKAPTKLIRMIKALFFERSITIATIHGNTQQFKPTRGLPQGDAMSPILWAIFYDPLLIKLQKETIGYTIPYSNINLPVMAYADDIHPIATNTDELQSQINIIHSFLEIHNMKIQAKKSHIIINQMKSSNIFNQCKLLNINGEIITDIRDKNTLTRILGVFWTMGNKHKATWQNTKETFVRTMKMINRKHLPGKIATHLINTVIIPRLQYRLQLIPLNKTLETFIDTKLKRYVKQKYKLPISTANNIIYDKRIGIGLNCFKERHLQKLVTDSMVLLATDNISGNTFNQYTDSVSQHYKLPLNMLEFPAMLKRPEKNKYTLNYLMSRLRENDLKIKVPKSKLQNSLYQYMQKDDYAENIYNLINMKITEIRQITRPTNEKETQSFSNWVLSQPMFIQNRYLKEPFVPEWYRAILRNLTKDFTLDYANPERSYKINEIFFVSMRNENLTFQNLENQTIEIWTDGSLDPNTKKMGSAALIKGKTSGEPNIIIQSKPPPGLESSTKAELWAIYKAMIKCPNNAKIEIMTDSQNAISNIKNVLNNKNPRQIMKYPNYRLLLAIIAKYKEFETPPILTKVKAHAGIENNEIVDQLAKEALQMDGEIIDEDWIKINFPYIIENNVIHDTYPQRVLQRQWQQQIQQQSNQKLEEKWKKTDIDFNATLSLTHKGMKRLNHLDASITNEHKWRLQMIFQQLPSLYTLSDKYNMTINTSCPRCLHTTETQNHIWTCRKTVERLPDINQAIDEQLRSTTTYQNYWKILAQDQAPQLHEIRNLVGPIDETFLTRPEAQGIITKSTYAKPFENTNKTKWTQLIIHTWITAFYEIIWMDRNKVLNERPNNNQKSIQTIPRLRFNRYIWYLNKCITQPQQNMIRINKRIWEEALEDRHIPKTNEQSPNLNRQNNFTDLDRAPPDLPPRNIIKISKRTWEETTKDHRTQRSTKQKYHESATQTTNNTTDTQLTTLKRKTNDQDELATKATRLKCKYNSNDDHQNKFNVSR
jgi:ribonuclease HI